MSSLPRCAGAATFVALVLIAGASPATASDPPRHVPSSFWRQVTRPEYRRIRELLQVAREELARAAAVQQNIDTFPRGLDRRRETEILVLLERAVEHLDDVRAIAPREPDVLYWLANALIDVRPYVLEDKREELDRRAMSLLEEVRSISATFEAAQVAASLGVIHTRRRDFVAAAGEYERALGDAYVPNPTTYSNLAEVTMLTGDLEGAVRYYERALEICRRRRNQTSLEPELLAMWGLGVAQDRLGEHLAASETILHALELGQATGSPMGILRGSGVFYEPPYEIHYYEALGYEALARLESNDTYLQNALESWRSYIHELGTDVVPWGALGRRHIEQLENRLREQNAPARRARSAR